MHVSWCYVGTYMPDPFCPELWTYVRVLQRVPSYIGTELILSPWKYGCVSSDYVQSDVWSPVCVTDFYRFKYLGFSFSHEVAKSMCDYWSELFPLRGVEISNNPISMIIIDIYILYVLLYPQHTCISDNIIKRYNFSLALFCCNCTDLPMDVYHFIHLPILLRVTAENDSPAQHPPPAPHVPDSQPPLHPPQKLHKRLSAYNTLECIYKIELTYSIP